ncbi:hypothetical protein NDU88_006124 [Pleurodeles waltl]|uniref:DUF4371 domain-containing protein n=1 Tax=Pleurodeles waltl TaxID=8319 RepID=A0AAV7VL43_PLEWA|nr:hypothetical protein NDU88_006124 [Pleurodeles waltl]
METICRAMKKAGVDIRENYTNCEKAPEFIRCEADILQQDIKKIVSNSRFICIIVDGSTDSAIIEQETVLVRVVSNGKPYTQFADLVPLEQAHAHGVLDGIAKGIQRLSLDLVASQNAPFFIQKPNSFGTERSPNASRAELVRESGARIKENTARQCREPDYYTFLFFYRSTV